MSRYQAVMCIFVEETLHIKSGEFAEATTKDQSWRTRSA